MTHQVHIIGGGLAGSEAAWQLAEAGIRVRLSEMRGVEATAAHKTDQLGELVCSNSFRSDDDTSNAVGLLHAEMRAMGSLILREADKHRVPAGSALAVDRDGYAAGVTAAIAGHPNITLVRERIDALPEGPAIIATGPLTAAALAGAVGTETGEEALAFFDALAPIAYHETIDMDVAWMASRWDKGDTKDYINCPMDKDQYLAFARGIETLRHGPMKPVGLDNPKTGRWPYAVVQLRQDNALGTLWNMVGFQTKLKHAEQVRIFRMIPGLEKAEFARLGGLHRNTFIKSPNLLDTSLRLKSRPNIRFAGQITGCEGYIESAGVGLLAGRFLAAELAGQEMPPPPSTTALGALLGHITGGADATTYQPMNVNFGLFPPLPDKVRKADRKRGYTDRAKTDLAQWLNA